MLQVHLVGWMSGWDSHTGIPAPDIAWLKKDAERGLFGPIQHYEGKNKQIKMRREMKDNAGMWFYPPDYPGVNTKNRPNPDDFFCSRVFVWRPVGVWKYSLKCPRGKDCAGLLQPQRKPLTLGLSGYHNRVLQGSATNFSQGPIFIIESFWRANCTPAKRARHKIWGVFWVASGVFA